MRTVRRSCRPRRLSQPLCVQGNGRRLLQLQVLRVSRTPRAWSDPRSDDSRRSNTLCHGDLVQCDALDANWPSSMLRHQATLLRGRRPRSQSSSLEIRASAIRIGASFVELPMCAEEMCLIDRGTERLDSVRLRTHRVQLHGSGCC
jgi:hypothetical protein